MTRQGVFDTDFYQKCAPRFGSSAAITAVGALLESLRRIQQDLLPDIVGQPSAVCTPPCAYRINPAYHDKQPRVRSTDIATKDL